MIKYHLLNFNEFPEESITLSIRSDALIKTVQFKENKLFINKTDYFYPIQSSTFNFTIGNYKVLKKWLGSRKNRKLEPKGIKLFKKIIYSIERTEDLIKTLNHLQLEF